MHLRSWQCTHPHKLVGCLNLVYWSRLRAASSICLCTVASAKANALVSTLSAKSGTLLTRPSEQPRVAGVWGAGAVALQGDLVAVVDSCKAAAPMLVLPAKFLVAFPLVYHYLGGVRHVLWDKSHYGNMVRPQGLRKV